MAVDTEAKAETEISPVSIDNANNNNNANINNNSDNIRSSSNNSSNNTKSLVDNNNESDVEFELDNSNQKTKAEGKDLSAACCCFWCRVPCSPSNFCPDCELVHYCSEAHFEFHKGKIIQGSGASVDCCYPFQIRFSKDAGRYLVATRDIQPNEIILEDHPVVVGPSRKQLQLATTTIDHVVCVECFKRVSSPSSAAKEAELARCPDCNFPICSDECVNREGGWHREYECKYFKSRNLKPASPIQDRKGLLLQISTITTLRLLLLKERLLNQTDGGGVESFYTPLLSEIPVNPLEKVLLGILKDDFAWNSESSFSPEKQSMMLEALREVSYNAKNLEDAGHGSGTGLYSRYSMMNHSCVPNAKSVIGDKLKSGFKLVARAKKLIGKGSEISVRYVGVNVGLPMRHIQMLAVWNFRCNCQRCLSPTDLGTFNSAIKCKANQCNDGYILPMEGGLKFICSKCGEDYSVVDVKAIIDRGMDIIRAKTLSKSLNPEDFEQTIVDLEAFFHPKSFMILQIDFLLVTLLSQKNPGSVASLNRLVELCKKLLDILDVLDEGTAKNKGKILKDLIPAKMNLAKLNLEKGTISVDVAKEVAKECRELAKEMIQCYK